MTKTRSVLLAALTLAWAGLSHADKMKSPNHIPVEDLKWFDTGIGPMQAAVAYGDCPKAPKWFDTGRSFLEISGWDLSAWFMRIPPSTGP